MCECERCKKAAIEIAKIDAEILPLHRLVSLRWCRQTPVVEGWYWTRVNVYDKDPEIVRLNINPESIDDFDRFEIYVTGEDDLQLLDEFIQQRGGEWCGPLLLPEAN